MKVVILAGGLGTRISEESIYKPKPMIEIGNMPIRWHIMKEYSDYGFHDLSLIHISGASATSPVSGESVSQREARPRPPLRGGCRRSDWGREPCHCPKPTRTEKPSPLGEGVCGPDHRRMRGSLLGIAHKRAVSAGSALISHLR